MTVFPDNKPVIMINEQFLELLRCGMYRVSPDLRLFEHVDWDALFQMSAPQTAA